MLDEPEKTRYDLHFRLLGFPVRVHPLFWVVAAVMGGSALNDDKNGLFLLLGWIAVVFVSILVHELGHSLAFRRYGARSHIVLWAFGGLAFGSPVVPVRRQRIFVSLAGPLAGFILCGLVYASNQATNWGSFANGQIAADLYFQLIFVNLYWGIFNLLPVYPLDGGQVSRELCEAKSRGRGVLVSLKISIGVAATVAVYSVLCEMNRRSHNDVLDFLPGWFPKGTTYTAILFAILAVQSYQLLQFHGRGYYYEGPDDRVPWEK